MEAKLFPKQKNKKKQRNDEFVSYFFGGDYIKPDWEGSKTVVVSSFFFRQSRIDNTRYRTHSGWKTKTLSIYTPRGVGTKDTTDTKHRHAKKTLSNFFGGVEDCFLLLLSFSLLTM